MEKEFIPYEQALALKELGFDEECLAVYRGGSLYGSGTSVNRYYESGHWQLEKNSNYNGDNWIASPTFSQAFRWFREKYNFDIVIQKKWRYSPNYNPKETFYTYYLFNFTLDRESEEYILEDTALAYKTHEEAELECLKKLIEIVNNK